MTQLRFEFVDFVDELYLPTPELVVRYPWFPNYFTAEAGYAYAYDTVAANLADGDHVLVIWTEDYWGGRTFVGERRFEVDNPQVNGPSAGLALD